MGRRVMLAADANPRLAADIDTSAGAAVISSELTETDLQHVVGGLARVWVDETILPDERDLVPGEGQ